MKMKFKDWINFKVNSDDIIMNCVDPTGLDRDNYIYPLGCCSEPNNCARFTNHPEVNSLMLFYSFRDSTDFTRRYITKKKWLGNVTAKNETVIYRGKIKTILDKTYQMTKLNPQDYYNELGKYKFVASPEGNGIDCYRHYETWMSKGIPIIERNAFIQKKYQGLPILWTTDYSEINDSYLERCYSQFFRERIRF